MHLLKVLYYNYYLVYKKVIRDPEPYVATVLALSFSQSLLFNGIGDIIALKISCYQIPVWAQFSLVILLIVINHFLIYPIGQAKEIIKLKPIFFNNKKLSIIITILFFLITTSWLFWGPIYGKYLLTQCK